MAASGTPQWAKNIVHTCMGLRRGEKILVVVDEPLSQARDALLAEAVRTGPAELWSYTFPDASRPFNEYPPALLALAAQVDAVILLLSTLDQTQETPAWVAGREAIRKGKARAGLGAFIDQSILDQEMSANYEEVAALTLSMAERLRGGSTAHITTALGSDLFLSLAGREWRMDTGILRERGTFGNLPAGEIFIAPVEDSAEGVLVIDKCLPGLLLSEPVRLIFKQGRVTHFEGGAGAAYFQKAFAQHGEPARVIAELGIGTNAKARLQGNIITDEKVLGTIHVAVGRNDFIGGMNIATTHIDGVIGQPTLVIDGEPVIVNGSTSVA